MAKQFSKKKFSQALYDANPVVITAVCNVLIEELEKRVDAKIDLCNSYLTDLQICLKECSHDRDNFLRGLDNSLKSWTEALNNPPKWIHDLVEQFVEIKNQLRVALEMKLIPENNKGDK